MKQERKKKTEYTKKKEDTKILGVRERRREGKRAMCKSEWARESCCFKESFYPKKRFSFDDSETRNRLQFDVAQVV